MIGHNNIWGYNNISNILTEQKQASLQQQIIDCIGTLEQASQHPVAPKPKEMNPLLLLT